MLNIKKRGLTQEELAEKVNLSTRQLQRIEKNEHQTSIDTLLNIINTLNIPDEEIIKTFKTKRLLSHYRIFYFI